MGKALLATTAALLIAGSSSTWGAVFNTNSDVAVDRNNPGTNLDTSNVQVQTQGSTSSNPRQFAFIQFTLGASTASSVTLSGKTVNNSNGTRVPGGYIFAKTDSFTDTTLTYNTSFLGSMPAGTITFADVTAYIAGQGWTQLDPGDGQNVLGQMAQGVQNHVYDTSSLPVLQTDLKNFYNANLGGTISFLFVASAPLNGNTPTWFNSENTTDPVNAQPFKLTVVEVPEPGALLLLAGGVVMLKARRKVS